MYTGYRVTESCSAVPYRRVWHIALYHGAVHSRMSHCILWMQMQLQTMRHMEQWTAVVKSEVLHDTLHSYDLRFNAVQCGAIQHALHYSIMYHYSTYIRNWQSMTVLQFNMLQHNMLQPNMLQPNMLQPNMLKQNMLKQNMLKQNMLKHNMLQHNMLHHNMLQHNMICYTIIWYATI